MPRQEVVFASDFHGSLAEPINGADLHCTQSPLSNVMAELLLGYHLGEAETFRIRLGRMASGSILPCRRLPAEVAPKVVPPLSSAAEIGRFVDTWGSRTANYKIGLEQEEALQLIALQNGIKCTLVSGTPARERDNVWGKLGPVIRKALNPAFQMILRGNTNDIMLAKCLEVGFLASLFSRVFLYDDDPNFVKTVCKLFYRRFGVVGFSPTSEEDMAKYPQMELPDAIEEMPAEIYWGTKLPQLAEMIADSKSPMEWYENLRAPKVIAGNRAPNTLTIS